VTEQTAKRPEPPQSLLSQAITPAYVRAVYQLLLGRDPENEEVVTRWTRQANVAAMLRRVISSPEFRAKIGKAHVEPPPFMPMTAPPQEIEWQTADDVTAALLAHVKRTWTHLGTERPHRHVLGSDDYAPDRIEKNKRQFFASGAFDCKGLVGALARQGLTPAQFPRLFEFGCGVGRVTPYFAATFAQVTACDVSPSYLAIARETVRTADAGKVTLNLGDADTFGMTEPFDLWFSRIVLQHNPPPVIAMILRRALTLLAPGGAAYFQVPTYGRGYRFAVADYLAGTVRSGQLNAEMHVLPQSAVFEIAGQAGCHALEAWPDGSTGRLPAELISTMFILRKS
jgi:SAM-dependent methyltransferase